MNVGTIREIKDNENRVGLTPSNVVMLVKEGHNVFVQCKSGIGAGFSDDDYKTAGAAMVASADKVVDDIDILVKVKEPQENEYPLLAKLRNKVLFTYLHLSAAPKSITHALLRNGVTGIAYETIFDTKGRTILLYPMSQIAGILSIQYGAQYLQRKYDGRGVSLGRVENADRAYVVIVGAGAVGSSAVISAAGLGAKVSVFDRDEQKLENLRHAINAELGNAAKNVMYIKSTDERLSESLKSADLLVGAVLVPGAKAPKVVNEEMVKAMPDGSVIVDVAIDQGGCVWGSKPTSHSNPIYELHKKIYCCITNMPGQVARQSTQALTNQTIKYLLTMASIGVIPALKADKGFLSGLNTYQGNITHQAVARDLDMMDKYKAPEF